MDAGFKKSAKLEHSDSGRLGKTIKRYHVIAVAERLFAQFLLHILIAYCGTTKTWNLPRFLIESMHGVARVIFEELA